MTLSEFSNALRILHSIDSDEVYLAIPHRAWLAFRDDAVDCFLRADDPTQAKLWAIIEARQPKKDAA